MDKTKLSRRSVLQTAVATTALAAPFVRSAAGEVVPSGKMVLAWHTNIAPRWLDPLQHDGGATGDNFLNVLQDALIKNFREKLYDHLALAEHFEFTEDAKSAVFQLRPGIKFHNGGTITPEDVKWSYEHYHGGWAKVLHEKTEGVEVAGDHTVRFFFKEPFLDFPRLLGTANVCGAGWVVPAKYYQQVGQDGFVQTPVGAGPYRLAAQQPGTKLEFQAFDDYYRPVQVKNFTIISVPDPATRVAMLERGEADIVYFVPGEMVARVQSNPNIMLAPVVSGNWWLEFPGFQDPKNPFHDKRVRKAISLAIDRDAMNQAECAGLGRVDGNWINDDVENALDWPKWSRDVAKAKNLMAEAGYPNGFKVVLKNRNVRVPYIDFGVFVVQEWRKIGVEAEHRPLETAAWFADGRDTGNFEVIINGVFNYMDDPDLFLERYTTGDTNNWGRFSDPRIDDLFARQTRALDPSERKRLVNEIERIVLENAYHIPGLWWARSVVHWAKVRNYVAPPNHYSNQKLQNVWLAED